MSDEVRSLVSYIESGVDNTAMCKMDNGVYVLAVSPQEKAPVKVLTKMAQVIKADIRRGKAEVADERENSQETS